MIYSRSTLTANTKMLNFLNFYNLKILTLSELKM